jgi:hypothetical protein
MKGPRKLYTPRVEAIGNCRLADAGPRFAKRWSVTCVACRGTTCFDTEAEARDVATRHGCHGEVR